MLAAAPFAYGPGYGAYGPAAFGGYGGYGLGLYNQKHPQQGRPGLGLQQLKTGGKFEDCVDALHNSGKYTTEGAEKCYDMAHGHVSLQNLATTAQNHMYTDCVDALHNSGLYTSEGDSRCMQVAGVLPDMKFDAIKAGEIAHFIIDAAHCSALGLGHPVAVALCIGKGLVVSTAVASAAHLITGHHLQNLNEKDHSHIY